MGGRAVSTFSLWVALSLVAWAGPAGRSKPDASDADAFPDVPANHWAYVARDPTFTGPMPTDSTPQREAARIKSSPLYRDDNVTEANWMSRAMRGFWDWLEKLFQRSDKASDSTVGAPSILGPWVVYTMWTILGALVVFFIGLAVRHVNWKFKLKRRSRALLEEDEPERTLDEWLEKATALEAHGQYREAVRCLYLACLLRFDEARIARFDRGQTNWEHLKRIHASANLPVDFDFEPPTLAFDHIWYGMRTNGPSDVQRFRAWYEEIDRTFKAKAA